MLIAKMKIDSVTLDQQAIPAAIRALLEEWGALAEAKTRQLTPQGVGGSQSGLRASIFHEVRESAGLFTGVLGSNLPYAEPVESGAKPHFPPVQALIPWVEKFISLKTGETAERVAFAIAKTIAKRGTPPYRMFNSGVAEAMLRLDTLAERLQLRVSQTLIKPQPGRES